MPSDATPKHMHAIVRGRVQGVGFRALVSRHARRLSVSGTVANLPDGTVELYAAGSAAQLDALVAALKGSAPPVRVDAIAVSWLDSPPCYQDFRIV